MGRAAATVTQGKGGERTMRRAHHHHPRCRERRSGMGHMYRFVEPVVLYALKRKGESHGYDLAGVVRECALTESEIERASLYRTLKHLEAAGHVTSRWEADQSGPARRLYRLTESGEQYLGEWVETLDRLSQAMARFVAEARSLGEDSR
ncbi:PadR family transcriptional regulator [Symbiobacterium thermophilum]